MATPEVIIRCPIVCLLNVDQIFPLDSGESVNKSEWDAQLSNDELTFTAHNTYYFDPLFAFLVSTVCICSFRRFRSSPFLLAWPGTIIYVAPNLHFYLITSLHLPSIQFFFFIFFIYIPLSCSGHLDTTLLCDYANYRTWMAMDYYHQKNH